MCRKSGVIFTPSYKKREDDNWSRRSHHVILACWLLTKLINLYCTTYLNMRGGIIATVGLLIKSGI